MFKRFFPIAIAASLAAFSLAAAQTPAAQAPRVDPNKAAADAARANPKGPLVPGLCVLGREEVVETSAVGVYAGGRMQAIAKEVDTELTAARNQAQTDFRALEAQRATLGDAFNTQAQALEQRFEALYQIRGREVQATSQVIQQRILQEMTPVIIDVFQARNCTLILDKTVAFMAADALDITKDVTTRLNARITQFPISKIVAQQAPAAGAPAAAAPAPAGGRPAQGPSR